MLRQKYNSLQRYRGSRPVPDRLASTPPTPGTRNISSASAA